MTLSLIIPAFNEHDRLPKTLADIHAWMKRQTDVTLIEVMIVDDGSTDDTAMIAGQWKDRLPTIGIRLEKNRGKGAAVRAGMERASGDLLLLYDADGATPMHEVTKLIRQLQAEGADIAIGSRVLGNRESLVSMRWHRQFIGRAYHFLCSKLVPGIHDTACGCKLFTNRAGKHLFSIQRIDRFAFDVEVLALALRYKYKIIEIPVEWQAVEKSKVRLVRDGLQMFWCVVRLYAR